MFKGMAEKLSNLANWSRETLQSKAELDPEEVVRIKKEKRDKKKWAYQCKTRMRKSFMPVQGALYEVRASRAMFPASARKLSEIDIKRFDGAVLATPGEAMMFVRMDWRNDTDKKYNKRAIDEANLYFLPEVYLNL